MKNYFKLCPALFLCCLLIRVNAQVSNADKVRYAKKYAFNYCIFNNYSKLDSNYHKTYKDASGLMFSIYGQFNENEKAKKKLINFILKKTSTFFSQRTALQDISKNIVICNCFNFYESAELKNFVIKLFSVK